MQRRTVAITIILVGIIAILFIILWLLLGNRAATDQQLDQTATVEPRRLPVVSQNQATEQVVIDEAETAASLRAVALTFAERFGSYSNQGQLENLGDLQSIMTTKMSSVAEQMIRSEMTTDTSVYYGVTTQALSATIEVYDEALQRAEILVNTQRLVAQGSTLNPAVTYQKLRLLLVSVAGTWKVDEATWE